MLREGLKKERYGTALSGEVKFSKRVYCGVCELYCWVGKIGRQENVSHGGEVGKGFI
jgi:hypothetical protein